MLVWSLLLSLAALFVSPGGVRQIFYPIDTMMNMKILMANVEEWSPLKMTEERGIGLLVVLFCIFLLVAARKAEICLDELLLLAAGTWLAVGHIRMLIVFGIFAGPILSRQLANVWENYEPEKDRILPNVVCVALSLAAVALAFPGSQDLERQVESISPVRALQYIKAHRLPGPMLNDYMYGGYLIWAAPEYPVMMDGRMVNSCCVMAAEVEGTSITTVEGIASDSELHPIQQCFLEEAALQCGICTPGFLIASKALLEKNPNPTEHEIRFWLAGNLCRCTGYDKIIRAVQKAGEMMRA